MTREGAISFQMWSRIIVRNISSRGHICKHLVCLLVISRWRPLQQPSWAYVWGYTAG